jgi:ribonuclease HII
MRRRFDPDLLPPAPDLAFEVSLWEAGVENIAGIDEAGRGALAGPVAAAAVILPSSSSIPAALDGLKDSKQLSSAQRNKWAEIIRVEARAWGVGFASHTEIDQWGIVPATRLAAQRAMDNFDLPIDHLLLDYLFLTEVRVPQTNLIKGDQRALSIAAASILAKTGRDKKLVELDSEFREYHFADHKGYATSQHLAALEHFGPSPVHRKSFSPLKEILHK